MLVDEIITEMKLLWGEFMKFLLFVEDSEKEEHEDVWVGNSGE